MSTILIIGKAHPDLMAQLAALSSCDVKYEPEISYADLMSIIGEAEGLITTTRLKIDAPLIAAATQLKFVGRLGSGLDQIDVAALTKRGIACINSPEGNRNAVAEHNVGLLLNLMHKINSSSAEIKKGLWIRDANRGEELAGKTVGIIGFGNTGQAFAKVLGSFDVSILAHDKYKSGFGNESITEASLETVLENAEVISLHLPLTEETFHYADENFFKACKKQPYFLNCSRGKVVDTNAIIEALDTMKIKAVGLDVLENEDLSSYSKEESIALNKLLNNERVIITPHIAGYSHQSFFKMGKVLLEKLMNQGLVTKK